MVDFFLDFNQNSYTKTLMDTPSEFDLIKIIQINVGGPKDKNFKGIFKLLYNLFHNNQEEVQEYFENEGIIYNLEEVINPMIQFKTFDEQTQDMYFNEGRAEGKAEGRAEGKAEGRAEGKAEGRAEGAFENSIEAAKNLLKENISEEIILRCFPNLTIDHLNKLQTEI